MAPRIDIPLRTNSGRSVRLNIIDNNDDGIDYTGSTFKLEIKPAAGGASVSTLTSGSGITHNDLTVGDITLNFPDGLSAGDFNYDLLALSAGDPETVCYGEIPVTAGITTP